MRSLALCALISWTLIAFSFGSGPAVAESFRLECGLKYFDFVDAKQMIYVNEQKRIYISRFDDDFIEFELEGWRWKIDRSTGFADLSTRGGGYSSSQCEKVKQKIQKF